MFSSEQDHCSGGKRKHSGELHCSRNNQDQVCRGDPLSFNGFIIFELWTEMEDNLIFSKALTDNEDIADKALENLPLGRWVIFSRCTLALVQAESYLKVCKILGWPTTYSIFNSDWLHIAIHHVSSLQPLKIDHVSQIWPAWRDGGDCELFGVGRGGFCFTIKYWWYSNSISKSISNLAIFSLASGLLLDWGEHRSCRGDEREAVILFNMLLKMVLNINLYVVATITNISLFIVGTITEWKVEGKDGRAVEAVRRLACPAQCSSGQPQVAASIIITFITTFLYSSLWFNHCHSGSTWFHLTIGFCIVLQLLAFTFFGQAFHASALHLKHLPRFNYSKSSTEADN